MPHISAIFLLTVFDLPGVHNLQAVLFIEYPHWRFDWKLLIGYWAEIVTDLSGPGDFGDKVSRLT